jgi:hypothetical protein
MFTGDLKNELEFAIPSLTLLLGVNAGAIAAPPLGKFLGEY